MSGIVGAHGRFDAAEGHRMLDRLTHRGPDGEGSVGLTDAWLGHRRLAIVDLEGGGQPLCTQALGRLWGMFAFVAADGEGGFVAARDVVGVAPLHWVRDDDAVVFASEIKAFDPARRDRVEPFPPGHTGTPDGGLQPFGSLPALAAGGASELIEPFADDTEPPERLLAAIRDTLIEAVERSMHADVPIGTPLSGGLDSSLITAIAARIARGQGWRLSTFSVGSADSDDLAAARLLAGELGTAHYERINSPDELIDWRVCTSAALQRVDRCAGANGLEPRIPFLDAAVVGLGLALPARWKLVHEDRGEKWLLRKAFEGWLPDELLWRR